MKVHCLQAAIVGVMLVATCPGDLYAWGKGHRLIRLWAVARLPEWQRERLGTEALDRLCRDYTSLQDKHAGGKAPELDPYCIVPDVRLSLHDVNPPETSATAILWYLDRITEELAADRADEAMKYLGVLCHWNEDPGCPSAHSSPVTELALKTLLPPPKEKARFNYLYGAGGIMDTGRYELEDVDYQPKLLGRTREEAALRIYQHQRLLRQNAATHIIPIVQDMMHGDGVEADRHRSAAALENGRHTADVIYTALCLATNRIDDEQFHWNSQRMTDWLPEFRGRMIPHPYYVTPFLVNQSMDAKRQLHPLRLPPDDSAEIESGYGMGTPFELDFVLTPGPVFDRFTCDVGLHPTAGPDGAVIFAVNVNDTELARVGPVAAGDPAVSINIDLPESNLVKLTLRTIADDDSEPTHNLAVWAEPTLHTSD